MYESNLGTDENRPDWWPAEVRRELQQGVPMYVDRAAVDALTTGTILRAVNVFANGGGIPRLWADTFEFRALPNNKAPPFLKNGRLGRLHADVRRGWELIEAHSEYSAELARRKQTIQQVDPTLDEEAVTRKARSYFIATREDRITDAVAQSAKSLAEAYYSEVGLHPDWKQWHGMSSVYCFDGQVITSIFHASAGYDKDKHDEWERRLVQKANEEIASLGFPKYRVAVKPNFFRTEPDYTMPEVISNADTALRTLQHDARFQPIVQPALAAAAVATLREWPGPDSDYEFRQ